jgi:hypothetical protein
MRLAVFKPMYPAFDMVRLFSKGLEALSVGVTSSENDTRIETVLAGLKFQVWRVCHKYIYYRLLKFFSLLIPIVIDMVKTSWIAGLALAATAVPINHFPFHQSHKLGQLIERGANTQTATANTTSMTIGDDSFDVASTSNLAVYFGRAQNNNYPSLYDLCINSNTNIVVMGFINQFNDGSLPSFAFLRTCKTPAIMTTTTSVSCPTLAQDIAFCQQQGKKVLLSLGGSSSNLTLHSTEEAKQAAQTLWNVFGMGSNVHSRWF